MANAQVMPWFEKNWYPLYNRDGMPSLGTLSEKDRVLFLIGYLLDQLCCGGSVTLYFNPSGAYAVEMAEALDTIGADRAAKVMRAINRMFPGGAPPTDDNKRDREMRKISKKASAKGRELEAIFDEWMPNGGERVLLQQLYDWWHAQPDE